MIVPFSHAMGLVGLLFILGMICTITRNSLIMVLLGLEIMLNAGALGLVAASLRWQQIDGQTMAIFVLVVAAAEVSLGLAMIVHASRHGSGAIQPSTDATDPKAPSDALPCRGKA